MAAISKTEYAARIGVTKAYLSKRSVKDRLAPAMVLVDGKLMIDADLADAIFAKTRDPSRYLGKKKPDRAPQRPSAPSSAVEPDADLAPGESFEKTKQQRESVKLEQDRLNLAARKGQTLPKQDVERACLAAAQAIRHHLRARNRHIAEKAATMDEAREIKVMLDEDDRGMFEFLSHEFARKLTIDLGGGGAG